MKEKEYRFRIQEGLYEGICVLKVSGNLSLGESCVAFREAFKRKIQEGLRFFIFDFGGLYNCDSSGLGEVLSALTRVKARTGDAVFVSCTGRVADVLQVTKFSTLLYQVDDLSTALAKFGVKPPVPVEIEYEDIYSVVVERRGGNIKKLVVYDHFKILEQYNIREIPPNDEPKKLSPKWLLLVVLTSLVTLCVVVYGFVWAAKAISSVSLLIAIFCLALLFFILLSALVLLLSGHLSEKTAAKLFGGVLAKIPGLGAWVPKTSKKAG